MFDLAPEDRTELRIALVMAGGVSLAVWMGGVCYEFYRLLRSQTEMSAETSPIYRGLLDLTAQRPVVDVVSGTSAGGLNGVLFSAALLTDLDLRSFGQVRDTWLTVASFRKLLRERNDPRPSLLQGDEVFYPAIREVLTAWTSTRAPVEREHPLDLFVTTTLLVGQRLSFLDAVGTTLHEIDHRANLRFHFEAGETPTGWEKLRDRLALAARASASYPVAFESTFVPVGRETKDPERPDMAANASFSESRFVMDGGLLNNRPLDLALEAVAGRGASGDVRRVAAFVVPDPGAPGTSTADVPEEPPSLGTVAKSVGLSIPFNDSIADDLRRLRQTNERVEDQRRRRDVLADLDDNLRERLAPALATTFADLFARSVARSIIELGRGQPVIANDPPRLLAFVARRLEAEQALASPVGHYVQDGGRRLYASHNWDSVIADPTDGTLPGWDHMESLQSDPSSTRAWPWGIDSARYVVETGITLLRQGSHLIALPTGEEETIQLRRKLGDLRGQLHQIRQDVLLLDRIDRFYWVWRMRELLRIDFRPLSLSEGRRHIRKWARLAFRYWPALPVKAPRDEITEETEAAVKALGLRPASGGTSAGLQSGEANALLELLAVRTAVILLASVPLIEGALGPTSVHKALVPAPEVEVFLKRYRGVVGLPTQVINQDGPIQAVVHRLLQMYVVQAALGVNIASEAPVELVQVSANAVSHLDGRTKPEQKLAGLQLGHFGAFLKQSWRANDWLWGRLDATDRLALMLLTPSRLRERLGRIDQPTEAALQELRSIVVTQAANGDPERESELKVIWERHEQDVAHELAFLNNDPAPTADPTLLPETAKLVAHALQQCILEEELPRLMDAIRLSGERGEDARVSIEGQHFADEVEAQIRTDVQGNRRVRPGEVGRLLALNRVGLEHWKAEVGTNMFTDVGSRATLAATQALSSPEADLGPLSWVMRRVQDLVTLGYFAAQGSVRRSTSAAAAITALIVTTGTILGVHFFVDGAEVPSWLVVPSLVILGALLLSSGRAKALEISLWVLAAILFTATGLDPSTREEINAGGILGLSLAAIIALVFVVLWRGPDVPFLRKWLRVGLIAVGVTSGLLVLWVIADPLAQAHLWLYENRLPAVLLSLPILLLGVVTLRSASRRKQPSS